MNYTQIGVIVVLVAAICEGIKFAGLSSRWIPLIAVGLAIVGAWVFTLQVDLLTTAAGVVTGLATTGAYRAIKTSILNK